MTLYITYILIASLSLTLARLIDTSEEKCVEFVLDIIQYYKSSCITILYDDSNERHGYVAAANLEKSTSLAKLSSGFSKTGFSASTITFSQLKDHKKFISTCSLRPTFLVLLNSNGSVEEFANLSISVSVKYAVWIVPNAILIESYLEYNDRHKDFLHLTSSTDVILANFNQGIIYKWYALENQTTMAKLATWRPGEGLVLGKPVHRMRGDLRGQTLRVATVKNMPLASFVDGKATGMFGDLLIELSKAMNFKIKYILATNNSYGMWNEHSGNWSGMMGLLATNKVDLAAADFRVTKERLRSVVFTLPLLSSYDRLYIQKPYEDTAWFGHLQTFSRGIWTSIGLLILGTPVLLTLITLIRGKRLLIDAIVEYYFHILGIYCQQGLTEFPANFSSRLVYLFTFMSSIVTYSAYSATLVSSFTIRSEVLPFSTLKEFTLDGSYKLIVIDNSAIYDMFANSTDPISRKMFSLMKPNLPQLADEAFDLICKEKVALYIHEILLPKMNLRCKVAGIKTGRRSSLSMALPKHSPYYQFINYHLQRFRDNGVLHRLKQKYIKKPRPSEPDCVAAGLQSTFSVLFLMVNGIILSTVILLLEKFHFKYKQQSCEMPIMFFKTTFNALYLKLGGRR